MADADVLGELFRQQSGRLVAALTRMLGMARIDLAEDVVQDALLAAMNAWQHGLPRDPAAWLFAVARNRALDVLRRERVRAAAPLQEEPSGDDDDDRARGTDDDLLRMMFACCAPSLTTESQTALVLRLVCGFGTAEVARAFLVDASAMEKRLVRAKKALVSEGRALDELSAGAEIKARMPAVLDALYLMFDAGYHSAQQAPLDPVLCADAIRLATLLASRADTRTPEVHALLALCCLHAARMPARVDDAGAFVPLEKQDRKRWDGALVALGMQHLSASASGDALSAFHLEAGIAAHHALAPSLADTPFAEIARLYDLLYARKPTAVVALGRAIARGRVLSPMAAVDELRAPPLLRLASYPFYWAALGDALLRAGKPDDARAAFTQGIAVARSDAERAMFRRRTSECTV